MRFILRHPLLILFVVAAIALSYGVYSRLAGGPVAGGGPGMMGGGGMGPVSVTVAEVIRQRLADEVESVGTAQANESVNLTAKVSDTVTAVHFEDGDLVEQGDILVELTNSAEAARLSEARSEMEDARRQYERLESLITTNLISQTDLETARTRFQTAEARLEGVIANMDDRLIRAPFSGMLGFRNISEGTLVTPNTVITTLDDISTIKLDFNIAEVFFAQLQSGLTVKANSIVYRGRDFEGVVQNIGSRIDEVTRSVQVRAEIDNSDRVFRPGMLLTVGLTLNERDTVVVPYGDADAL
ncbi:MAG: efflux RND transporter periplasmic adaptor subunit, partial [Pseudohongiella sp.]